MMTAERWYYHIRWLIVFEKCWAISPRRTLAKTVDIYDVLVGVCNTSCFRYLISHNSYFNMALFIKIPLTSSIKVQLISFRRQNYVAAFLAYSIGVMIYNWIFRPLKLYSFNSECSDRFFDRLSNGVSECTNILRI